MTWASETRASAAGFLATATPGRIKPSSAFGLSERGRRWRVRRWIAAIHVYGLTTTEPSSRCLRTRAFTPSPNPGNTGEPASDPYPPTFHAGDHRFESGWGYY